MPFYVYGMSVAYMCVDHVYACRCLWRSEEGSEISRDGVTCSPQQSDVGDGNWTQVCFLNCGDMSPGLSIANLIHIGIYIYFRLHFKSEGDRFSIWLYIMEKVNGY